MAASPDDKALFVLAERVGALLKSQGHCLAAAESCTGGWLAKCVTDVAGSSAWFDRGYVTYTNPSKRELLDVAEATLAQYGAVSEATVREMTAGALRHSQADIAVAISGIAGPDGGTPDKPVGTVWFAWQRRDGVAGCRRECLPGDREAVRRQAVAVALQGILELYGVTVPAEAPASARLFFALWPDQAVRDALAQTLHPLRQTLAARWVKPEHYHITLAFIGAVPQEQVGLLAERAASLPFLPCELVLQRLEFWRRPQVLCLTATEVPPPLAGLVEAINGVAAGLSLPVERRPLRPHMTVVRKLLRMPPDLAVPPVAWPVRDYCLVESRLSSEGPTYTVLRRFAGAAPAAAEAVPSPPPVP